MKWLPITLQALVLHFVMLLASIDTLAAPARGVIDFGRSGLVFTAEDETLVSFSQERFFPADVSNPAGPVVRFFGKVQVDALDGVVRGEQQIRRPLARGDQSKVTGRLSPVVRFEPGPGMPAGTIIQVPVDMVVEGQFEIPAFLFGPSGSATNRFVASLQMRNVSSNSATLASAGYRYDWSAANGSSGVTESFSHTPDMFAASPAFHSEVLIEDPLEDQYRHGFEDIRMHVDFPYSVGSGTLIEITANIESSSAAFAGAANGNWFNSAVLDLKLPAGVVVADEHGVPLALNWDGVAAPIPEPATWLFFATGLALVTYTARVASKARGGCVGA